MGEGNLFYKGKSEKVPEKEKPFGRSKGIMFFNLVQIAEWVPGGKLIQFPDRFFIRRRRRGHQLYHSDRLTLRIIGCHGSFRQDSRPYGY
jgi:hypothetical protein